MMNENRKLLLTVRGFIEGIGRLFSRRRVHDGEKVEGELMEIRVEKVLPGCVEPWFECKSKPMKSEHEPKIMDSKESMLSGEVIKIDKILCNENLCVKRYKKDK